jgi:hypothetical protein
MDILQHNQSDRNNEPSANRDYLQSLTVADLMQEAIDTYRAHPDKHRSEEYAWRWLRMAIEPMSFDIRSEHTLSGRMYVGYWAGNAICSVPMFSGDTCNYDGIARMMNDFFQATYPKTLSASRWCITHVAQPVEVN